MTPQQEAARGRFRSEKKKSNSFREWKSAYFLLDFYDSMETEVDGSDNSDDWDAGADDATKTVNARRREKVWKGKFQSFEQNPGEYIARRNEQRATMKQRREDAWARDRENADRMWAEHYGRIAAAELSAQGPDDQGPPAPAGQGPQVPISQGSSDVAAPFQIPIRSAIATGNNDVDEDESDTGEPMDLDD